jgi:nuclear migration protein JNM1
MSLAKKYAGLPDLDAAPEIYETPALTEDNSTTRTDTLQTDSPAHSDDDSDANLVRQRIDTESARRRFEPSLVDARDVNFSDTIAVGERRSYRTRRRRWRRRNTDDASNSESEDETLSGRIARLKREAEEVRLELARRDEGEFKDSVEQQVGPSEEDGLDELDKLVNGLGDGTHVSQKVKAEENFLRSLSETKPPATNGTKPDKPHSSTASPSTVTALAVFAERLSTLESALGLSTLPTPPTSILPTLDHLSTQITALSTTLSPSTRSSTQTGNPNLDALQARIRALTIEADKLTASRKAANTSLDELYDSRIRFNAQRHIRDKPATNGPDTLASIEKSEAGIHTDLFLSEHASKIAALYQLLPTITELQPLLPVVLERLRSLSVIHAGAAEARAELDEVMRRQGEMEVEVKKWREAVEGAEMKMEEVKGQMRENVDVVGKMVKGVEQKVKTLK